MRGKTDTVTLQPDQFLIMITRGFGFQSNTISIILEEASRRNLPVKVN